MEAGKTLSIDIVAEICSFLPAKLVGQLRCVSKPLRESLSGPHFVRKHLNNRRNKENLILTFPNHPVYTITDVGDGNVSSEPRFQPELANRWMRVHGSCNGLVLLVGGELGRRDIFLVNPTTLSQVQVPDSTLSLETSRSTSKYGLGYDVASDDYKIVKLSHDVFGSENDNTFVDMYSVKEGVWKRLEPSPYDHSASRWPGVFFNGSIHWLVSRKNPGCPLLIVALDLVNEKFKEIPIPTMTGEQYVWRNQLVVFKGCLCIFGRTTFWMMGEYTVEESWVESSFNPPYNTAKRVCFVVDDEVCFVGYDEVMLSNETRLVVHDLKTGIMLKDLVVDGVPASIWDGGAFVESLVSPIMHLE